MIEMIEAIIDQYAELGEKKSALEKSRGIISQLGALPEIPADADNKDELIATIVAMHKKYAEFKSFIDRMNDSTIRLIAERTEYKSEDIMNQITALKNRMDLAEKQLEVVTEDTLRNKYEDIYAQSQASVDSLRQIVYYRKSCQRDMLAKLNEYQPSKMASY